MNDQTAHNLSEAVRRLNESILNFVKYIGAARSWIGDPLTISDLEEILRDLSREIQFNPDNAVHYINRGNIYSDIRDYDWAVLDYDEALRINTENAKAYHYRGMLYFCKGEYDMAISDYDEAIRINPKYAEAYYERSEAYDCIKKSNQARTDADIALKLGFDPQAYAEYSWFERIEDLFQLCPRNAKVYYYRGLVHADKGDYNLAIADYNETIRLDPGCAGAYHERAEAYRAIVDYDDYDKAIMDYDKAIMDYDKAQRLGYGYRSTPGFGLLGISDPTIELFFERGEIYAQKGDYESAIADMSEVIERDFYFNADYDEFVLDGFYWTSDGLSSNFGSDPAARAYNNRGFYHHKKGEGDLAIADLKEALRLYNEQVDLDPDSKPDFAIMYLNLGSVYHAKGDVELAIENYDNVVRICANYVKDFVNSKFARGGQEEIHKAVKLLKSVVDDPTHSESFAAYYSGVSILFSGNGPKARKRFESARKLGFKDNNKIAEHLENLKSRY